MRNFLNKLLALFWLNTKRMDDKRIATLKIPEGIKEINSLRYTPGDNKMHLLDVYYPEGTKESDKLPVIIDIHGGGWMYGDKELNKIYCLNLAKRGYVVFNMSYRLYPEVNAKQQLEDVAACLTWIKANLKKFPCDEKNIFLTGDSAGGMLACFTAMLSVSLEMRDIFRIADTGLRFNAVGLTCPVTRMSGVKPMKYYTEIMLGENFRREIWAPYMNVDKLMTLGKMPPTFLLTSSGDILAKGETLYTAEIFEKFGVPYRLMNFSSADGKALPHVFPVLYPESASGKRAIDEMLGFFNEYTV
ncbi:MAG: alpha/beta hydrolase [Acutalibacteraceae bacterium]